MASSLLPQGSGLFEKSFEQSVFARWDAFDAASDRIRGVKYASDRPASFLPFIIYEYGLDILQPYVPDLSALIIEGVQWERVRGTPQAVALALRWVGYTAQIVPHKTTRAYWNSFQLYFTELPRYDEPDLARIEGVVGLSVPVRSQFRRGVFGYDATAMILDGGRLDGALLDFESGTTYRDGKTLWSFGRLTQIQHVLTEDEGEGMGNWLPPAEDDSTPWITMNYPWVTANVMWAANAAVQRAALMAAYFRSRTAYMEFLNSSGQTIGYRKCKVAQVRSMTGGPYSVSGTPYSISNSGPFVYFEARTDFGDAQDVTAASVRLVVNPVLKSGVPTGRLWLGPDDIVSGNRFAQNSINLDMRKTVRQQVKILLRF